jgi:hypothetical protein
VHKDTIAAALAAAGQQGELREYGTIANTPIARKALAGKLAKPAAALRFRYHTRRANR